jgi:predicted GH43/DUF377 family glycosyl hydrolase
MSVAIETIPEMAGARRLGPEVAGQIRLAPSVALFATALPQRQTAPMSVASMPAAGLQLPHPAIEALPEFVGRLMPEQLWPGACRVFNGSIVRWGGRLIMAFRIERYDAMNELGICEVGDDLCSCTGAHLINLPPEPGAHFEDPRLAVVNRQLYLSFAHVSFGVMTVCRQRIVKLGGDTLDFAEEIEVRFGRAGAGIIEKNWMPFERENGRLGVVYSQQPHVVVDVGTRKGFTTAGITEWPLGGYLSGRTPPVRVDPGNVPAYLELFGGHVKHQGRGGRYYFGAQLIAASTPYPIIAATMNPLVWASESSQTIFSSRPGSGHPICIYPAGAVVDGDEIIVSCGVNDSYIAFLCFSLAAILRQMTPVNIEGKFLKNGRA